MEGRALLPGDDGTAPEEEEEAADLSLKTILIFLVIATCTLVLLYLFYNVSMGHI